MKNSIKNKVKINISIRMWFTLLVMVGLGVSTTIAGVFVEIIRMFHVPSYLPDVIWFVVISTGIGWLIHYFFSMKFIHPVMRLNRAMKAVAEGDYSIRLEQKRELKEIQEIYSNFNLMAQELGTTEILQTDFVSNVSHEFKTPINAIEGYATLLQGQEELSMAEKEAYVEKILINTHRLSKLVGNMLLLTKLDNQAIQSKQTKFRLDEQIRQSIVILEPAWEIKNIEFDVEMEDIEFVGNESLLHHVWDNLIGNAIKFSPIDGCIKIRMHKNEEAIVFSVEDEGPGIQEKDQKHIFNRFYQSDSSHKEEGNGLGLALVKQIVGLHEGEISVSNLSKGCRFTVKL